MRTALRAVVTGLALAGLVLAGAGSVNAASPDPNATVGGRLSAAGREVTVLNQGSLSVRVNMTAEVVSVPLDAFVLAPGEARTVEFEGEPTGRVYATLVGILDAAGGADANSVVLGVTLRPYTPPFDWTPVGLAALVLSGLAFLAYRWRVWRWRITVKRG